MILYHAALRKNNMLLQDAMIFIKNGRIERIVDKFQKELLEEAKTTDMKGLFLQPAWIDSHLHFPGNLLFENYGVLLNGRSTVEGYFSALEKNKCQAEWLRGFGWNALVMEGHFREMQDFLEKKYSARPVLLFSDDYHSCICNSQALLQIANSGLSVNPDKYGVLREKDIFVLSNGLPQMLFTDTELEQAILEYQDFLLQMGITAVQTLMFLGGNGDREWHVLRQLDEKGMLKLKVNLALTVQPYEELSELEERFQKLKTYETDHIKINTVKVYMDGVVESKTAYLLKPYEKCDSCGIPFWDNEKLRALCTKVDGNGRQVHIHAIGDAAVHQAVEALTFAMDTNHTVGQNRHVITHLQLADDIDIEKMGKYGIIAAIQPYWFPQQKEHYPLDEMYLGERAEEEYKAAALKNRGVMLTGSSDSPVTGRPDPLIGIRMAAQRDWEQERVSVEDMIAAFTTNGAYQLGREQELGALQEGFYADLIGFDRELTEETIGDAKLRFCMVEGSITLG